MRKASLKTLLFVIIGFTGSSLAKAQTFKTPTIQEWEESRKQSINICPIAPIFGIFSANYERMIAPHHGLMIRGGYESIKQDYSAANLDMNDKADILNYRYHTNGTLDSFFLGAFTRYRKFDGDGNLNGTAFNVGINEVTLGLNAGRKWIWGNGFNFTFQAGYGHMMDSQEISESGAGYENAVQEFKDGYDLYGGFFGEVSIGFAF